MGTITGLTAARMLAIEAESVVDGDVVGDNLILTKHDGTQINAGSVRGPQGDKGDPGSITSSPAGGDLTGNYPNPGIALGVVGKENLDSTALALFVPSGAMLPFAGASAPSGYLLCDGSAVSRSVYADLFTAIGTSWGAGDGSTTFNLPNLTDRSPVGKSGSKSLGTTGGSESVVLTTGNLPPHAHTINHTHSNATFTVKYQADVPTSGAGTRIMQVDAVGASGTSSGTASIPVPAFSGNSGNGPGTSDPVTVRNPYAAVSYIIKT